MSLKENELHQAFGIRSVTCLMEHLSNVQTQFASVLVGHNKGVIRYADDVNEFESGTARAGEIDDTVGRLS